ncbi:hypothetical protein ABT391_29140 [Streptomyces jumonjinensis]|uniref:hypothetical protein n=1 Tax=Streptomyces jumonjinensis TaxID=1945 RepID=UPI00331659D6
MATKYDHVVQLVRYEDDDLDETSVLAALLVIRTLRDKLVLDERRLIKAARTRKVTWSRIADALELKSRQAAERRYLQLREDLDNIAGDDLTQAERVEVARAHRDRHSEYAWASRHADRITALAERLSSIPSLQQRADRSPPAGKLNERAVNSAVYEGRPTPPPVQMPWPGRLKEAVTAYQSHLRATRTAQKDSRPPQTPAPESPLTPFMLDRLLHELFGLIGNALDIDLHDHRDITEDVKALYTEAGTAAPRAVRE